MGYGAKPGGDAPPLEQPRAAPADARMFHPDQPRIPANNPHGGRWTKPGAGGGSGPAADAAGDDSGDAGGDDATFTDGGDASDFGGDGWSGADSDTPKIGDGDGATLMRVADDNEKFDLQKEDAEGGTHAIERHVGKSDSFLLGRVNGTIILGPYDDYEIVAAGSFTSIDAANKLINSTIDENRNSIEYYFRSIRSYIDPDFEAVKSFDAPTGKQAFRMSVRSQLYMRPTYDVMVVFRNDSSLPRGYRFVNAYPFNRKN